MTSSNTITHTNFCLPFCLFCFQIFENLIILVVLQSVTDTVCWPDPRFVFLTAFQNFKFLFCSSCCPHGQGLIPNRSDMRGHPSLFTEVRISRPGLAHLHLYRLRIVFAQPLFFPDINHLLDTPSVSSSPSFCCTTRPGVCMYQPCG